MLKRLVLAAFCAFANPASAQVVYDNGTAVQDAVLARNLFLLTSNQSTVVPSQTLGSQLRDALSASIQNNPIFNNPWTACVSGNVQSVQCTPWAALTTYIVGNVVSNGGHMYYAVTSTCVSAASIGPTTVTNSSITDGTCSWLYLGEPRTATNDANGPTVSVVSGSAPFASNLYWDFQHYSQFYSLQGVTSGTAYGSYYLPLYSMNQKVSSNAYGYGGRVCTNVTDSKFAITISNGSPPFSIVIDGRLLSPQADLSNSGNPATTVIDFSATSGYKTRTVCVQGIQNFPIYGGIITTNLGVIGKPANANLLQASFIYDSYDAGSGYGPFSAYSTFSSQVGWWLGWMPNSMGVGGTGVQNPGSYTNYITRLTDTYNAANIAAANIVLFNVSTNDASCTGAVTGSCPIGSETTAIQTLLSNIRSLSPKALIVGVGTSGINLGSNFAGFRTEDALGAAAFASWGDPAGSSMHCYVPLASTTPPSLFVGSYQSGVPSGLGSTSFLITADVTHPNDGGTQAMAQYVASQIANTCIPLVK